MRFLAYTGASGSRSSPLPNTPSPRVSGTNLWYHIIFLRIRISGECIRAVFLINASCFLDDACMVIMTISMINIDWVLAAPYKETLCNFKSASSSFCLVFSTLRPWKKIYIIWSPQYWSKIDNLSGAREWTFRFKKCEKSSILQSCQYRVLFSADVDYSILYKIKGIWLLKRTELLKSIRKLYWYISPGITIHTLKNKGRPTSFHPKMSQSPAPFRSQSCTPKATLYPCRCNQLKCAPCKVLVCTRISVHPSECKPTPFIFAPFSVQKCTFLWLPDSASIWLHSLNVHPYQ